MSDLNLEFVEDEEPKKPIYLRHFSGPEYKTMEDHGRLNTQHEKIKRFMADGRWRTLQEISEATGAPQASVSAQLRHLKKPGFGGHEVNRRPRGGRAQGLFEYQVILEWKTYDIFGSKEAHRRGA